VHASSVLRQGAQAGHGAALVDRLGVAQVQRLVLAVDQRHLSAIDLALALGDESGDLFALNGDELVAVDFDSLLARHREAGGAATITVAQPRSPFGVVDLDDGDTVTGFSEAGSIPYWVSCGIYVLSEEALERFPERGDHETSTFPELAAEGRLKAYRHGGLWLTVNTPKELRAAADHVEAHPEWLA